MSCVCEATPDSVVTETLADRIQSQTIQSLETRTEAVGTFIRWIRSLLRSDEMDDELWGFIEAIGEIGKLGDDEAEDICHTMIVKNGSIIDVETDLFGGYRDYDWWLSTFMLHDTSPTYQADYLVGFTRAAAVLLGCEV